MTNGNDLLEHTEKCDECLETEELKEQGKLTETEAEDKKWQCFCSRGTE